jgi:tetraacyldisaccharide 4'-kinase
MLLESLHRFGLRLRHRAYDSGWLASKRASICVVSVGNLAMGGTGKTPLVQKLVRDLGSTCKMAIALRGYRSRAEQLAAPIRVTAAMDSALCGDEALLHATQFPHVGIWAGRSRYQSAQAAAEDGAELLLLDDGMQHRALERDVEIVVIDARDRLSAQRLFPFGRLRELPERLKRADLIVLHHAESEEGDESGMLSPFSDAPSVMTRMAVSQESQSFLKGKRVGYFCGIGRPERFAETLLSAGALIVAHQHLQDHRGIDEKGLLNLWNRARAQGAEAIVCTAKDRVKLPVFSHEIPLHTVEAEIVILAGRLRWMNLLESIKQKVEQRKGIL